MCEQVQRWIIGLRFAAPVGFVLSISSQFVSDFTHDAQQ